MNIQKRITALISAPRLRVSNLLPHDDALVIQLSLWCLHDGIFLTCHLFQCWIGQPLDYTVHYTREQFPRRKDWQLPNGISHSLETDREKTSRIVIFIFFSTDMLVYNWQGTTKHCKNICCCLCDHTNKMGVTPACRHFPPAAEGGLSANVGQ